MNVYDIDFEGVYPVGNCLVLAAKDKREARKLAEKTITHTKVIGIKKVNLNKTGVICYLSGIY